MITATYSNITIAQSTFKDNRRYEILTFNHCNVTIISSTFIKNDGNLLYERNLIDNTMTVSTLTIMSCEFRNNYLSNKLEYLLDIPNSDILIYDTKFIGNKARILNASRSVTTHNSTFKYNHGSAMNLIKCIVDIFNSVFNNNEAVTTRLRNSTIHIHGSEFKENVAERSGAAIQCSGIKSLVIFKGICTLADNQAITGGAIFLDCRAQIAHGACNSDNSQQHSII